MGDVPPLDSAKALRYAVGISSGRYAAPVWFAAEAGLWRVDGDWLVHDRPASLGDEYGPATDPATRWIPVDKVLTWEQDDTSDEAWEWPTTRPGIRETIAELRDSAPRRQAEHSERLAAEFAAEETSKRRRWRP